MSLSRGRVAFAALEVLLLLAVPVLGWLGFRLVLDTTDGRAVDPELDPSEPGYEAFVEPTPVALVAGAGEDGDLSWVAVLGLGGPDGRGGSVLFVPVATVAGGATIAERWASGGASGAAAAVAELLDAGFADVIVLEPARMAALLAPVAPLHFELADDLPGFEPGEVVLAADRVVELLLLRDDGETDLARLARHETVWRAWLAAVAASSDPDAVPGEATGGIARYVRGLAGGSTSFDAAPVAAEPVGDGEDERFEPDVEALRALVAERIPFPVAAGPGGRPRVRVLDGAGVEGLALRVARDAVRAGAQITVIGNADRFDLRTSKVVYFDAAVESDAAELATALGIDAVERQAGPNPDDLVDVTVVAGADLAAAYGLSSG